MNTEESMAEANRILGEAGWIAHPDWEGAYAKGSLVGGIHPDKQGCSIKDWMKIQPGHPLHSADTPDEPHEAAAWLVRSVASSQVAQPVSPSPEPVHEEAIEDHGEAVASEGEQAASADEFGCVDESGVVGYFEGEGAAERDALDADFTHSPRLDFDTPDLGQELADDPDYAPQGQDRFYGLDDLDRRRNLRIGDVAVHAVQLSAQVALTVNEQPDEYARVQGYVVTNLDKNTGAFTGSDQAAWNRFIELDAARSQQAAIERARQEKTAFLLAADRAEVESFDAGADWP